MRRRFSEAPCAPRRRGGLVGRAALVLLLVALLGWVALAEASHAAAARLPPPRFSLSINGESPAAVSLNWSNPGMPVFAEYGIYYATSPHGNQTEVATIANQSETSYFAAGLTPGVTYYWQVVAYDGLGGSTSTAVVAQPQPPTASLSAAEVNATAVDLAWTNNAHYGGAVQFLSYQVDAAENNGSYAALATLTNVANQTYTATDLAPSATYSFLLQTSDQCIGATNCGSLGGPSISASGVTNVTIAHPLTLSVTANATNVTPGSSVSFSAVAHGGKPPYTILWTFGDGATGKGPQVTHTFTNNGTYVVNCTVSDRYGSSIDQGLGVTVASASPGGNQSGNGTGNGGTGGNGSGSGSGSGSGGGGTGGGGGGTGGGGGSGNSPAPKPSAPGVPYVMLATIAAIVVLVGAMLWMALLLARRSPRTTPARDRRPPAPPPPPIDLRMNPRAEPAAPPPPAPPAPPVASTARPPSDDIDEMMDQLEIAARESA